MRRVGAWAIATLALVTGAWGAKAYLKPLGALVPQTRQTLLTAQAILQETHHLQGGVERVRNNVHEMQRQEKLLTEQVEQSTAVLAAMRRQREQNEQTQHLLAAMLVEERSAAEAMRLADQQGSKTIATVAATARELAALSDSAAQIERSSREIDGKLDRLTDEMEGAAENFAAIARWKEAPAKAKDRLADWWRRLREWFRW